MPRIPTPTSQVSALVGRSQRNAPLTRANPDAFGAGIGRGMQALGQGVDNLAAVADARLERKRKEEVANLMAQSDFTARELQIRNEVGPDAAGYQERVVSEYQQWVDEKANSIEDDRAREAFRMEMMGRTPSVSSRSAQYEFSADAAYSELQANTSLTALTNRILVNPGDYEDLVANGDAIIDLRSDITASQRAGMKQQWRYNSAVARFSGMFEAASTPGEIDAVVAQMTSEEWAGSIPTAKLSTMLNTAETAKNAIRTARDVQARAALDRLDDRAADPMALIPQAELAAVQELVANSDNPVTQARMARMVRDQEIVKQYRKATPSQLRDAAQPSAVSALPGEERVKLSTAGSAFGVSLEYLTRTTVGGGDVPVRGLVETMLRDAPASVRAATKIGNDYRSPQQQADIIANQMVRGKFGFTDAERAQWVSDVATMGPVAAGDKWATLFGGAREGSKRLRDWIALPGKSNHQHGIAADLQFGTDEARQWFHENAEKYGGNFRMGHEPWHIEVTNPGQYSAPSVKIGDEFIQRALGTPGVRDRLNGNETPERIVAAYASVARNSMKEVLQRNVSDEELYMAHKLGIGAATQLALERAEGNPEAVKQYRDLTAEYAQAGPRQGVTGSEYARSEVLANMARNANTRVGSDPMTYADQTGVFALNDLFSEDGFAERGQNAQNVADYYSIPLSDMKPFTESEAATLKKQIGEASADDVINMLAEIETMGGGVARAALSQISELEDVYAYAGGLQMETGQGSVAGDVVRGQKRLDDNPDIRGQVGATDEDLSQAFLNATGGSLFELAPRQRQSVMNAALAHYVETRVARGAAGAFDDNAFAESVQAVLGGRQGAPALDDVNGQTTVMPPGVTGEQVETAFELMTVADWTNLSVQGLPPRYADGQLAEPEDIADEASLKAIGGGQYAVTLDDGSYLVTGRVASSGRMERYLMQPTQEAIANVINERTRERPQLDDPASAREPVDTQREDVINALEDGLTAEEVQALVQKYGATWAYDQQGNRIVP